MTETTQAEQTPAELTGRTIDALAIAEAKNRAKRIRAGFTAWTELEKDILAAWVARDWATLSYQSWDQYMADQFGDCLPQFKSGVERSQIILDLSDAGMSQRAIAAATRASQTTVSRTLAQAAAAEDAADDADESPEPGAEEGFDREELLHYGATTEQIEDDAFRAALTDLLHEQGLPMRGFTTANKIRPRSAPRSRMPGSA